MSLLAALMMWSQITALAVIDPVVEAAPDGANAALYFVIRNSSGTEDRLVGVTCDCAERIEIHYMVGAGSRRRMNVQPSLAMPPSRLVEVAPGGSRHLMLIGLRRPAGA